MKSFDVQLTCIGDVKSFVNAANARDCDIDVVAGHYTIDAKSIMGIFSIDLAKPLRVEVHGNDGEADAFRDSVASFLVQ